MTAPVVETASSATTAVVVHPVLTGKAPDDLGVARNLSEAVGLAEAIGLVVVEARSCKVSKIRPATMLGSGTTDEIGRVIDESGTEVCIVDAALTPIQQRNLELAWHCKVLDRTALILEIFGARARTHEGSLQVELAALQYQRSRLVRSWTHLERQRGGYGFLGGPGESQLEIDRRLTDQRIAKLKTEIGDIRRTRGLHRSARRRASHPTVALVGYTNAGKSTLFNRLTNSKVVARNMLFATLDPTMRGVTLPSGRRVILGDTVGFISDLPTELVVSFRATLEEIVEAEIILHVQDAASPELQEQRSVVEQIVSDLMEESNVPILDVYNKTDLLAEDSRHCLAATAAPDAQLVSAETGEGCDRLLGAIDRLLLSQRTVFTYQIPADDGAALAWLYANGEVISNQPQDMSVLVKVALQSPDAGRFTRRFHVEPV